MAVNLDSTRIDAHDPKLATMLRNLQGNILKGHGRDHVALIFLEFQAVAGLKAGFGAVASRVVTSALAQRDQTDRFKATGLTGGLFGNVFLTARGYGKLGLDDSVVAAAFPEPPGSFGVLSNFKEGMQAHGDEMNDPDPSTWDPGLGTGTIDALILLADDDPARLKTSADQVGRDVSAFARVLTVERGDALRNAAGDGLEHFGYLDGRSQPIYFADDLAGEGTTATWDPSEPLRRVLVPDGTVTAPDCFGSYFVFRKLEQDVRGFKTREQDLADALGLTGTDRERAGALAVGRFEDGTPVVLSPNDGFTPAKDNDFTYAGDTGGLKCPFQGHIRKTNPRGDIVREFGQPEESAERARRITRRGIPFGTRATPPGTDQDLSTLPTGGVGLLFMCFQASIANQFAFIQSQWADNEGFLHGGVGLDPVVGQHPPGGPAPSPQSWPPSWGQNAPPVSFSFGQFVTLKGGEFFFAPSLPFLASLSGP